MSNELVLNTAFYPLAHIEKAAALFRQKAIVRITKLDEQHVAVRCDKPHLLHEFVNTLLLIRKHE